MVTQEYFDGLRLRVGDAVLFKGKNSEQLLGHYRGRVGGFVTLEYDLQDGCAADTYQLSDLEILNPEPCCDHINNPHYGSIVDAGFEVE